MNKINMLLLSGMMICSQNVYVMNPLPIKLNVTQIAISSVPGFLLLAAAFYGGKYKAEKDHKIDEQKTFSEKVETLNKKIAELTNTNELYAQEKNSLVRQVAELEKPIQTDLEKNKNNNTENINLKFSSDRAKILVYNTVTNEIIKEYYIGEQNDSGKCKSNLSFPNFGIFQYSNETLKS